MYFSLCFSSQFISVGFLFLWWNHSILQWQVSVIIRLWKQIIEKSEMDKMRKMLCVLDCCQQLTVSSLFYQEKIKIMLYRTFPVCERWFLNKCAHFNFCWKAEILLCFYLLAAGKHKIKMNSYSSYCIHCIFCLSTNNGTQSFCMKASFYAGH